MEGRLPLRRIHRRNRGAISMSLGEVMEGLGRVYGNSRTPLSKSAGKQDFMQGNACHWRRYTARVGINNPIPQHDCSILRQWSRCWLLSRFRERWIAICIWVPSMQCAHMIATMNTWSCRCYRAPIEWPQKMRYASISIIHLSLKRANGITR